MVHCVFNSTGLWCIVLVKARMTRTSPAAYPANICIHVSAAATEARCPANAAYVKRFERCEFLKPVTIASTPGVQYAVFSLQLWWDEANTVCGTIGKRLVKLANPSMEAELHTAVNSVAGSTYW
jgi:hypothetical protein